jgi:hypothetical protein
MKRTEWRKKIWISRKTKQRGKGEQRETMKRMTRKKKRMRKKRKTKKRRNAQTKWMRKKSKTAATPQKVERGNESW